MDSRAFSDPALTQKELTLLTPGDSLHELIWQAAPTSP